MTDLKYEPLFIYGTLRYTIVRNIICRRFIPSTKVQLPGYKKVGLNIIPAADSVVSGQIIQVSAKELARLDRYERTPLRYQRSLIDVAGVSAWVYLKQPK